MLLSSLLINNKPPKTQFTTEIIFTNLARRVREGKLLLPLSKEIKSKYNVKSLKFQLSTAIESIIELDNFQQVRIKKDNLSKEWFLLVIYKIEVKDKPKGSDIIGIDLGLSNLTTLTFKDSVDNYIINGRSIKSKNS